MTESSSHPPEPCPECGTTRQERLLGVQMAEMLAGASERAKREAKPDDPVKMLCRMAREFGYELVPIAPEKDSSGI